MYKRQIHNATTGQPTETPRPTMYTRRTQPHDTITYKLYVPWYYSTCLPVFCARSCCTAAAIFQRDTICILLPVFFCDTLLRCCRDLSTAMYRLYPLHLFFVRMSCCTAGAIFQRLYTDCIIFTCFLCDILLHCRDLPTAIYRLYPLTCFLCACLVALLPRSFNGYFVAGFRRTVLAPNAPVPARPPRHQGGTYIVMAVAMLDVDGCCDDINACCHDVHGC